MNTYRDYFTGAFAMIRSMIGLIISVPESAENFHDIELIDVIFYYNTYSSFYPYPLCIII